MTYYATIAANQPRGSGYWEIHADSYEKARELAFRHCPDGRWSMMYDSLDDVHPLDRKRHGVITGTATTPTHE